jgi:riboflavin kinase/FMN adenylyltransferase
MPAGTNVHQVDFEANLYGEQARVRFTHFLRSERKFDGIEALKEQLDLDIAHARGLLSK